MTGLGTYKDLTASLPSPLSLQKNIYSFSDLESCSDRQQQLFACYFLQVNLEKKSWNFIVCQLAGQMTVSCIKSKDSRSYTGRAYFGSSKVRLCSSTITRSEFHSQILIFGLDHTWFWGHINKVSV